MSQAKISYFDQAAVTWWDDNPVRIALMKAVGEAVLREVQPTTDMRMLDYGCGTGLIFRTLGVAHSIHHHGFDRGELKSLIAESGFADTKDVTAYTICKPVDGGTERDFPVFLVTARREKTR